jgi:Acetyltransferase (GNAT) domain
MTVGSPYPSESDRKREHESVWGNEMIGNQRVSLVNADTGGPRKVYDRIWSEAKRSPRAALWFGAPEGPSKGIHAERPNWPLMLMSVAILSILLLDGGMDPDEWNSVNLPFFFLLVGLCVFGAAYGLSHDLKTNFHGWTQHRYVVRLGEDKDIGAGDIYHDKINAVCMLEIALAEQWRGRRLGSVATRMMLRKSFEEFGARRVESTALSTNEASLRMSDRMIGEGILKDRYTVFGKPVDEHLFRLLRTEWDQQNALKTTTEPER